MPRAGSQPPPPGGGVPTTPMNVGEFANPPFAVLPDPGAVFARRAARSVALAGTGGHLAPYLRFLGGLAGAQGEALAGLPEVTLPDSATLDLARRHAMPPLGRVDLGDRAALAAFAAVLAGLDRVEMPGATRAAWSAVMAAGPEARAAMLAAVRDGEVPPDALAAHLLAAAALQVHLTRLAARLDAESLQRITDGACPACGSSPVASAVVTRDGAANTRFCTCALCATDWHVVRVRCLSCAEEKDISFKTVAPEGGAGPGRESAVKAEACGACGTYVKILYQTVDATLDPQTDDVASLALDLLMQADGYRRGAANPFLLGY